VRDPRVSVILPVFNVAAFVRAAVESVLEQSWKDLELVVIDDGSTDATADEIGSIEDPRIVMLSQKRAGIAAGRNAVLRCARGEYLAFIDGDDLWLPGKLEQDVAFLDGHPEADLIFSSVRMVDEEGRDLGRTVRKWDGPLPLRDLIIEDLIVPSTVVLRREAAEQTGWFDETLPGGSDYDYWLRMAFMRPGRQYGSSRVSALYRIRTGQMTGDCEHQSQAWLRIMAKVRASAPGTFAEVERMSAANFYRAVAASAYEKDDGESARKYFREAMGAAPGFLLRDRRTWLLGGALLSARLLPHTAHRKLERFARTARAQASASRTTSLPKSSAQKLECHDHRSNAQCGATDQ